MAAKGTCGAASFCSTEIAVVRIGGSGSGGEAQLACGSTRRHQRAANGVWCRAHGVAEEGGGCAELMMVREGGNKAVAGTGERA